MYELDEILKHKDWCVHCETEEDAIFLLGKLDARGLKWCGGRKYSMGTYWHIYKSETVYYIADGTYSGLEYAQSEGDIIIEFGDVLFEQQPVSISMTFEDLLGGMIDD